MLAGPAPPGVAAGFDASTRAVARLLFSPRYLYVFEATSVLILAALVGAVVAGPEGRAVSASTMVQHALLLSLALFAIGAVGVFLRRNIITVFMCVELMLNAVNLSFVAFSRALGTLDAQVLVFFVLTVAAAEAAVGLAIIIALHRHSDTLDVDAFNLLKW